MKKIFGFLVIIILFLGINVHAFTGWKTINGKKYYYINDEKVRGYRTIDGKLYYFYYGNYALRIGWQETDNGKFYSDKNGVVARGWQTIDGKKYYFNKSYPYNALKYYQEIDGKTYYFYGSGILRYGWQETSIGKTYSNSDGTVAKGWKTIDGKKYYFNKSYPYNALRYYQEIDGNLYYFYGSGILRYGWQETLIGKTYSKSDGTVAKGWQTIDGKKYYFNKSYPYNALKYYQEIDGKNYYFYGTGALRVGWQTTENGVFYSNSDGTLPTGWQTIDGKKYYFKDSYPFNALRYYQEIDGETYYFYGTGALRIGWQKLDNKWYYSNEEGIVQTGLQTIGNKVYYFNNSHPYNAVTGVNRIDGNLYYFDPTTKERRTGWIGSGSTYYHAEDDYILQTGLVTIGNTKYKFDSNGKLMGFSTKNGKTYYTDPNGKLAKGTVRMCNRYFKFDEIDGHFIKFVNKKSVIDVSAHQGTIDWHKVKYSGEVDAVILRIGYGSEAVDTYFERNITELKKYNIPFSVYLFSYAETESDAILEAKFLVNTLKKYKPSLTSNIPIYYDLEPWHYTMNGHYYSSTHVSNATYGKIIKAFVNYVETNYKKKTRIYASRDYITSHFPDDYQKYATWVAAWTSNLNYNGPYEGWQYTDVGKVAGISGNVDMSWFYY